MAKKNKNFGPATVQLRIPEQVLLSIKPDGRGKLVLDLLAGCGDMVVSWTEDDEIQSSTLAVHDLLR